MAAEIKKDFKKPRLYWYVDLKWISGILFLTSLFVAIQVFTLYKITSPQLAIRIITITTASMYSPDGLDDTKTLDEVREKMLAEKTEVFYPFPDKTIAITKSDIQTMSARDLRLKIFSQLAEKIYYNKLDIKSVGQSETGQNNAFKQFGLIAIFTEQFHNSVSSMLWWFALPCVLFLALMIYFSAGFGRLVSPAVVIIIAAGPSALISLAIANAPRRQPVSAAKADDVMARVGGVLSDVVPQTVTQISKIYGALLLIAVLLLLTAGLGKLITVIKKGKKNQSSIPSVTKH